LKIKTPHANKIYLGKQKTHSDFKREMSKNEFTLDKLVIRQSYSNHYQKFKSGLWSSIWWTM